MSLKLVSKDITKMEVNAIVNAANKTLLGGGGVDGAIHSAAGPKLLEETRTLNGCEVGEAKITGAYNLPAKHVIHTVGPIWEGGASNEKSLLENAYRNSLKIAKERDIQTIAFPLLSAGAYGYPKEDAIKIGILTIENFLKDNDMEVFLVLHGQETYELAKSIEKEIL